MINSKISTELRGRVEDRIDAWHVAVEHEIETQSSVLVFGRCRSRPVVLKVIRNHGDEWHSGDVLDAFDGNAVVRVLDRFDGAVLLERLVPGNSLVGMAVNGDDGQATGILADVIRRMHPRAITSPTPTVHDWGRGFERYATCGDCQIPKSLVDAARHVYFELCRSQSQPRLLHGDLHHSNVLLDTERGWVAIDPKGVVGELEYEVGAALRNPLESPELFTDPARIERRVDRFQRELHLDAGRILAWAFAQAVLSAIWAVEDGGAIGPDNAWIALANNVRPMLEGND